MGVSAQTITEQGATVWGINCYADNASKIVVTRFINLFEAWNALAELFGGKAEPVSFHNFNAYSIAFNFFINNYNGYYFWFAASDDTLAGSMQMAEVFCRHAVESGFMAEVGSTDAPPAIAETETVMPETGTRINLRAYADNYDQATDFIDNSSFFGSIDISGRVTDLDTGSAIGGAVIEITSGAASSSTLSASDGSYALTAVVSGGEGSGVIQGVDFALLFNTDLLIKVTPANTELLADGSSTSDITIEVKDLQGNPLKDRTFDLEVSADAGPGTIQPAQAVTDENGMIQAIYTSFKVEPGHNVSNPRHEVTISARDTATGVTGTNWIFVNQYQLSVHHGEYIPACTRCTFPSEFTISVTDYWNNPILNAPLTLQIESGNSGGTLVLDPNSNAAQQEITLTTDNNGNATAYYKWQGSLDIPETVQKVVVLEGITNAQVTKDVNVHGLDISLARVEEAGFTGVTGQQAFLKIYFKDRTHPDLPLDRFNADDPNKLGLRVTINQYHSDGVNTSLTFEDIGGWEQDEGGLYAKMYTTPHMPYIVPMNDGNSWYEVRIDPVVDHDTDLPDLFRANNDTIIVLKTGSPDGWLHTWLDDGILTPHNWAGVVFKCVGRFLPVVSQAMTVIDTLNQVYKMDALSLGQSTGQVLTDALEAKSTMLSPVNNAINLTRTAALNNIVGCLQDTYAVHKENSTQSSSANSGKVCSILPIPLQELILSSALDEGDAGMLSTYQDRFAHGLLLDLPEKRGIVIYGADAGNVTMRDASGLVIEESDNMHADGNVAVYFLPVDEQFKLDVNSDQTFNIAVYEAGSDGTNRTTFRHDIQTTADLTASMTISSKSDYVLELDTDGDGVSDESLNAQTTTLDVEKPKITSLQPEQGKTVSGRDASILANFADNQGGIGIDLQAVKIFVDGVDLSSSANVQPDSLALALPEIEVGNHNVRLIVSDLDGNAAISEWTFNVKQGFSLSIGNTTLLFAIGGGVFLILLFGTIFTISKLRKQRHSQLQSQSMEKAEGAKEQQNKPSQPASPASKDSSWLLTLVISGLAICIALSVVFLALNEFIPGLSIQSTGEIIFTDILKMFGGGSLLSLLGFLLLRGGIKSIFIRHSVVEDDLGSRRAKHGCSTMLIGFIQSFLGFLILSIGIGLIALSLLQQVLPELGINLIF